jgi:hypothetical protein
LRHYVSSAPSFFTQFFPKKLRFRHVRNSRHNIIAAALLVFGAFSYLSVREYQKQNTRDRQETSSYSAEATEKYAADCLKDFKPISTWANCIINSIDANRTAQRANQDLKAQQEMAEWAYALLLLSVGGLVVSGCGLIALFVSLSQTRTVIKDTREIGEKQIRAYLSSDAIKIIFDHNTQAILEIKYSWKNFGQSPALKCRLHGAHRFVPFGQSKDPIRECIGFLEAQTLGNLVSQPEQNIYWSGVGATSEDVRKWLSGETEMFIHCAVTYLDVFGLICKVESAEIAIPRILGRREDIIFMALSHTNRQIYGVSPPA